MLRNGDRITGEISRVWDGELFIEPGYADEFAVDLADVVTIESAQTFEIELPDREKIEGRLVLDASGEQLLVTADGPRSFEVAGIEELEQIDEEFDWSVRSDISISGSDGNTETSNVMIQAAGQVEYGDHRHQLDLRIDRLEQDGESTRDETNARYRYSWFMSDRWFLAGGVGYERDPERELSYRVTPGAGLGYQFFEDADRLFEVSVSAVGVSEKLAGSTEESLAGLWQLRYERDLIDGDLEFYHEHRLWEYLSGRDNRLVETITGFRWDVWGDIYFNTQFDWDWESDPAAGAEKEDIRYSVGLGVEFD